MRAAWTRVQWVCARNTLKKFFRLTLTLLCATAAGVYAAGNERRGELTLAAAIAATLQRNPALQSAGFELRSADARIGQAALMPSPELSVQLENFGGSGRVRAVDAAETTFMLSQAIELGGKRRQRMQVAQAGRSLQRSANAAQQLDVLAEVTRRYIHVAADQEQVKLSERAAALAQKTLTAVGQRVRAAKSPAVELHRARIALTRARIDEEHAEHALQASRRKLAAMWGDSEADFADVSNHLFTLPQPQDFSTLLARLKRNPDFIRFADEQRLRDAELRLAETRRIPDMQIGAGIRRLQEGGDNAFVVSFSLPLFSAERSGPAIAEASAQRERVALDQRDASIRAQAQLFEIYQELQHSLTEARILRDEILPQTETILQQTEYAYQRGRYSYLEWIAAQRELLDAQRGLIEAAANAHRFFAEIERLTGETLAAQAQ